MRRSVTRVKTATKRCENLWQGNKGLLLSSRTFTQQLPVDVKGRPGNGPTVRRKETTSDMTPGRRRCDPCVLASHLPRGKTFTLFFISWSRSISLLRATAWLEAKTTRAREWSYRCRCDGGADAFTSGSSGSIWLAELSACGCNLERGCRFLWKEKHDDDEEKPVYSNWLSAGPEWVVLTRRHAPPWSISASRHRPSGWWSRLLATASCRSQPGERTDHNHLQPCHSVSASAHVRILLTTTQASKWATVKANTKPNLVVSAPAGVQLPRRLADQLLREEMLKWQQCVPKSGLKAYHWGVLMYN